MIGSEFILSLVQDNMETIPIIHVRRGFFILKIKKTDKNEKKDNTKKEFKEKELTHMWGLRGEGAWLQCSLCVRIL